MRLYVAVLIAFIVAGCAYTPEQLSARNAGLMRDRVNMYSGQTSEAYIRWTQESRTF